MEHSPGYALPYEAAFGRESEEKGIRQFLLLLQNARQLGQYRRAQLDSYARKITGKIDPYAWQAFARLDSELSQEIADLATEAGKHYQELVKQNGDRLLEITYECRMHKDDRGEAAVCRGSLQSLGSFDLESNSFQSVVITADGEREYIRLNDQLKDLR